MKKYVKELIILLIQTLLFYLFPLFSGPTDTMGMIVIMLIVTLILSIIIGLISKEKIKYIYPVIICILFIPTVFIHYNESAMIHTIWYLVISGFGIIIGPIICKLKKVGD